MELLLGGLVRRFLFLEVFTKPVDSSTKCDVLGFWSSICAIAAWRSRCLQMVGLALISSTASAYFLGALNGKITLYFQAVHNLFCFTPKLPAFAIGMPSLRRHSTLSCKVGFCFQSILKILRLMFDLAVFLNGFQFVPLLSPSLSI